MLPEGLWGMVNNAGLCTLGPVEWLSMKSIRRDPEVNVFGLIAATKAFLPLVRRGKGRYILFKSSAFSFGKLLALLFGNVGSISIQNYPLLHIIALIPFQTSLSIIFFVFK